jgi:hypothetical protein
MSVSPARDAHSQKDVCAHLGAQNASTKASNGASPGGHNDPRGSECASRLGETLVFFENERLAWARRTLGPQGLPKRVQKGTLECSKIVQKAVFFQASFICENGALA